MTTDNTYTPATDGLAARATAAAADRHQAQISAHAPHQVKRGALCGKPLISKARSDCAPNLTERKSRAAKTDDAIQGILDSFAFDYFQFVVANAHGKSDCKVGGPVESRAVSNAVRYFEGAGMRFGAPTSGGRGYANGLSFAFPGEVEAVGFVSSGSTSGHMPNITIKGGRGACATLAPLAQETFRGLRLTRADTSLDVMCGESGWRDLLRLSRRFAQARAMNRPDIRGMDTPEDGRTFYLGSREASVFLRVYEKGKAENARARKAGRPELACPDWVRIEFQFQKVEGRKKAAKGAMTPAELICSHDWPRFWLAHAAKELGMTEGIEQAALHKAAYEPHVKTLDSTADHGIKQYGKTFLKLAARNIIDADFGGKVEAAVITPEELEDVALEIFAKKLRESRLSVDCIADARLDVDETLDERSVAVAEMLHDRRQLLYHKQAEAREALAGQVAAVSIDDDGLDHLYARVIAARDMADDAAREVWSWAAE